MKRLIILLAAALMTAAAFNSCNQYDDTELRNSLSDLEERIADLEEAVRAEQDNINALNELINRIESGLTVDGIEETADGYDIILSNGERIPVTTEAPQVRINEETGNWEINNGDGWEDTGIRARAEDGMDRESFLEGIDEDEDYYYITLKGGNVVVLPKTAGLSFRFGSDEQVLYFNNGETREISYTMTGNVTVMTVNKPDGWRVAVNEETSVMSITAPAEDNLFAETAGVISVVLTDTHGKNFAALLNVIIGSAPAKIGDYIYSDGTYSSVLDESKTVSGIVFWAGDPTAYDPGLKTDHPECVNGLAVAIKYAAENIAWRPSDADVSSWVADNITYTNAIYSYTMTPLDLRYGYSNTKAYEDYNAAHPDAPLTVIETVRQYRAAVAVPEGSSGWYLPDGKEFVLMCHGETSTPAIDMNWSFDSSVDVAEIINASLKNVSGAQLLSTNDCLWLSNELSSTSQFTGTFRTLENSSTDAYATASMDNYWFGNDLVAYNPEYEFWLSGNEDTPLMAALDIEFNGSAVGVYYKVWKGDLSSEEELLLFNNTVNGGTLQNKGAAANFMYTAYDTEYTVCTVAVDSDGNLGDLSVSVVTFTEEGTSHDYSLFDEYFNDFIEGLYPELTMSPAIMSPESFR